MKKTIKILSVIALFVAIGFSMAACNDGGNGDGDKKVVTFHIHEVAHGVFQLTVQGANITHNNVSNVIIMSETDPLKGTLVAGGVSIYANHWRDFFILSSTQPFNNVLQYELNTSYIAELESGTLNLTNEQWALDTWGYSNTDGGMYPPNGNTIYKLLNPQANVNFSN